MNIRPRPYLVIPKLIEQATWGGSYIAQAKGWTERQGIGTVRIGQSYELFSGSNLSLLDDSSDPDFTGELTNNIDVERVTIVPHAISLAELIARDPAAVLGQGVVQERGSSLTLLIKFTQALGNSFQTHIKTGLSHPDYKPKPEAWYYFEPGSITLGVRLDADWQAYEMAVRHIDKAMQELSGRVEAGLVGIEEARAQAGKLVAAHDPWQYVNRLTVNKDKVVDLSAGGIHHSWEEDSILAPLGNVLLEVQAEAMDAVSTFRSFDKGKITDDGTVRPVHIDAYFEAIDRSRTANDPSLLVRDPALVKQTDGYTYQSLVASPYYKMDKLSLRSSGARYDEEITGFRHFFVQSGAVHIEAKGQRLAVQAGHACFVPADCRVVSLINSTQNAEILICY